jgi:hypothetical protein
MGYLIIVIIQLQQLRQLVDVFFRSVSGHIRTEHSFQGAVETFYLPLTLWMVGTAANVPDVKIVQLFVKLGLEL